MGRLRRECGSIGRVLILAFAFCIGTVAATDDSQASTFLKNGVKAGDRTGLRLVRPPAAGQKRFVRLPAPGGPAAADRPAAKASQAWFWALTETGAEHASPERWQVALGRLRESRATRGPIYGARMLSRIAEAWREPVREAARRHGISEAVLLAVIAVESAGQLNARSPKGAMGLMQLIPATAARFGVGDAYDAGQNVLGGAAYLDFLLRRFDGDIILALAGYNAGEGAVDKHRGVPPYAETRDYVVRVLDAIVAAGELCGGAPADPRRACELPEPALRLAPPA